MGQVALQAFGDPDALSGAAAELIHASGQEAIASRGHFTWFLAGGNTPKRTYELLAARSSQDREFWEGTHVFWGDERCVPPDHPDSNYRLAKQALLDYVPIPEKNIHRIQAELPSPAVAAKLYESTVPDRPDLILLGMGEDGHIASLFPNSPALDEQDRRVMAVEGAKMPRQRITITPPVLRAARQILVLVSGKGKAEALQHSFTPQGDYHAVPARLVRDGRWLADRAALSLVST